MILNAFFLAFRQIKRNFLRAILTMLGVIIGVGAVIIMITLGNGTTQVITERMSSLGSNILLIFPARDQTPGKGGRKQFMLQDVEELKLQVGYLTLRYLRQVFWRNFAKATLKPKHKESMQNIL